MTKPGFVLDRLKLLFSSDDLVNKLKVYNEFITKRNKQPKAEKICYCGHTIDCSCNNPSIEEFTHNLINNNINEKDL
jgi:hypothetical protein